MVPPVARRWERPGQTGGSQDDRDVQCRADGQPEGHREVQAGNQ